MEHIQQILFVIIAIILVAKILASILKRFNLPPVMAMIMIGLLLGPTGFKIITHESATSEFEVIHLFAQIGVIILLFLAGLETDLGEIKKVGVNSFLVALGGIVFPFALGFGITLLFFHNDLARDIPAAVIMGLILTATSVSVSVMTLMDIGKLKTVEGNVIVSAAIIDDVIGIIMLSVIFTLLDNNAGFHEVIMNIVLITGYFAAVFIVGIFIIPYLAKFIDLVKSEMFYLVFSFFLMFLFAWTAERIEIAAITGAFFAGVFIGRTKYRHSIEEGAKIIGHTLFITLFFVFIGLQTNLRILNLKILPFIICFVLVAFGGKILGCGFFAKIIGFDWKRAFRIGAGMSPRGEVALIIASLAMSGGHTFITSREFTAVICMVIVTAFITPFLLKISFKE